ncbi:MAG: pyridoxal phosphate-dependent aminotransferase [Armatimonadota bacterium]
MKNLRYRLAKAADNLEGQPMFKVLAKAQELERIGRDIVHFEIGDPDFMTPPNIIEAAYESLRRGETHYTSSMGLHDFRETVLQTTNRTRGFTPALNQVLVTPSANIIIYYAIRCVVDPGDEVIVPDPGFPSYYSAIKFCCAVPVPVPLREENAFRMSPGDVRRAITPRTRLIILNSPQNPTGAVMTAEEIDAIAEIAEEYDIFLYSDEVYARMIFDDTTPFHSPASRDRCQERTIVANGFSKAFAMTGWRLGVAIGPEDVIEKMGLLLQTTSSCVAPFVQRAGIEAIIGDQSRVRAMMAEYQERRDILVDGLNSIKGISCLKPGGAIYVFPNITGTGLTSEAFSDLMLDKAGVALLPGTNFGQSGKGFVRMCYAVSRERILEGIGRIRGVLDSF